MKLNIKVLNDNCMPYKPNKDDAGIDLKANIDKRISLTQHTTTIVPTGVCVEIPEGHFGLLLPRSGHSQRGIAVEIGTIDPGYTGEIKVILTNNSTIPYHLTPYERIGQLVIVPYVNVEDFEIVDELKTTERSDKGFGSSGK